MNDSNQELVESEREITVADAAVMSAIQKAELDNQITTARAFPRSLKQFTTECREGALMSDGAAAACSYLLPRGGKNIEGPSIRFAEILFSSWANANLATRIMEEGKDFVTVMAIFHDLQKNTKQGAEVRRRIVDSEGRRFNIDMIGVTIAAAQAIARRNVILSGVPKAYWGAIYEETRELARGDIKSLKTRRTAALDWFAKKGVHEQMACAALGVAGVEDIGLDELLALNGMKTAILEGTLVETVFAPKETTEPQSMKGKPKTKSPQPKNAPKPEPQRTASASGQKITADQGTVIRDKLKEEGVATTLFLAKLSLGKIEDLPAGMYAKALKIIEELSAE